ncbi:motility protein B [Clostridium acetireducens DSM 10703]|jgi:chemotaxis protein MotB|uniref:Motility protein B n=1 Tax=Clostridium acetireducens DSM 10703 TaxID=1121290 RepID=A0A1E8F0X5_9CLOT|nr:flagellar motor protein MotB [Clostridium acetireducens]OFI06815.1 motility protein B [Clostridium acetireducens DSM 10703]
MSRRKKKASASGGGGSSWMNTYADTVTLLLTFFVLLYSFSSVDAQKFKQVASAFQSVLAGQAGQTIYDFNMKNGEVPLVGETIEMGSATGGREEELYDKVKEYIKENKIDKDMEVTKDGRGIIIQLHDNVLFESGKADIKPESKPILNKINNFLRTIPNNVIVEGHTDNVPISNYRYPTNWELSTARAVNVLRYFVENLGENPSKFTAAGYGPFKPVAPNDTEANKSKNRRVNILILSSEKETGKK